MPNFSPAANHSDLASKGAFTSKGILKSLCRLDRLQSSARTDDIPSESNRVTKEVVS